MTIELKTGQITELNVALVPVQPTHELKEGVNFVHYTRATTALPEALTNIRDLVEIVWHQLPSSEWQRFYFYDGYPMGELEKLEYGKDYTVVVTADCVWEPQVQ